MEEDKFSYKNLRVTPQAVRRTADLCGKKLRNCIKMTYNVSN